MNEMDVKLNANKINEHYNHSYVQQQQQIQVPQTKLLNTQVFYYSEPIINYHTSLSQISTAPNSGNCLPAPVSAYPFNIYEWMCSMGVMNGQEGTHIVYEPHCDQKIYYQGAKIGDFSS